MLLSERSCHEIIKMLKEYRSARGRLMRNYGSRRARIICNSANIRADHYINMMNTYEDKITSEDVKYFALIVDTFGQMQRESMLNKLQKYADFDVFWYVEQYNSGLIKRVSNPVKNNLFNMSAKQMDDLRSKYKSICDDLQKNRNVSHNIALADRYRSDAYAYARAIVNGNIDIAPENLESVHAYLQTVCFPYVDGDDADIAKRLLNDRIQQYKDCISPEEKQKSNTSEHLKQKISLTKQKLKDKKQAVKQDSQRFVQNLSDSAVSAMCSVKSKIDEKHKQIKNARQNKQDKKIDKKVFVNTERVIEKVENIAQKASDKTKEFFGSVKSRINEKREQHKIIRKSVAEIVSQKFKNILNNARENFATTTVVTEEEPQVMEPVSNTDKLKNTNKKINRSLFTRVAAVAAIAVVLVGGIAGFNSGTNKKTEIKPVKKEVKEVKKQVVQNAVSVDTAYMNALKNYYNSALDIIAGPQKKADVLNKIENQVKSGNIALSDSINIERIAYAYFIYREYGFKINVLDLAVNGNQKLTQQQQNELVRVIMDAGERGTGVQQMAKQKVEARGGQMSRHSKFKNATKQQQRQHLVNIGLLKKAHVR